MGTLRSANEPLFLRPKAYALLSHLARNMGRVVPKSELMDVVWPGVYVTEDSLTQSVREIRKVLGEDMVRTVSRRPGSERGWPLARRQIALIEEGASFSPLDYALRGVPFESRADAEHLAEGVRLALGEAAPEVPQSTTTTM